MKILSIGNSFSQDAQRYISKIAAARGEELYTKNLYIGGCSLERHHSNMLTDSHDYTEEIGGVSTGRPISIKEALSEGGWDVITLQQASHFSTRYDTYQPYLNELAAYVRELAPEAKLYIHETWFYEDGSEKLAMMKYERHEDMLADIKAAYANAAEEIKADGIIRSGEMLGLMRSRGVEKIHRDTFHASLGVSRYAIGLLWYATLTGRDVLNDTFSDTDEPMTDDEMRIARECAQEISDAN